MQKLAVLYARVSGDDRHREGRNLLGQLQMCREFAQEQSYQIVAELHEDDRGASGAAFELPQLNLVRDMAQRGEFNVLVVREIDRLSRSLAKQLFVEEELKRHGVQIVYVIGEYPDTPEGSLNKNIRASIAEYERLKISERMVRGRILKVKAGSVLVYGRPPYGYSVTERDKKWVLEIKEEEARIVRLIFEWYTGCDGLGGCLSMDAIREKLNAMQAPTYADLRKEGQGKLRPYGEWSRAQIGRILARETYAGTWHFRKNAKQNGKVVPRPPEEHLPVEVPAIIDRKVWQRAQSLRAENAANSRRNLRHPYLLRTRLRCGQCGAAVTAFRTRNRQGRHYTYYRCAAARDKKHVQYVRDCAAPNFRVDDVDPLVWAWLQSLLTDPTALRQGIEAMQEEQEARRAPLRRRLEDIEAQLAEKHRHLERLLDAYLTEAFPKEMLEERRARLDKAIAELERERSVLDAQLREQAFTEEQVKDLESIAAQIAAGLEGAGGDHDLQRFVVETLDVRARLAIEEGQKVVHVQCMLEDEGLSVGSHTTHRRHRPCHCHPSPRPSVLAETR